MDGSDPMAVFEYASAEQIWSMAPTAFLVVEDGVIRAANGAAHLVFGYDADSLVGMTVEDLVPAEVRFDHGRKREVYDLNPTSRVMSDRPGLMAARADGDIIPVDVGLFPLGGTGHRTFVVVHDLSVHLAAERELQEAYRRVEVAEDRERIGRELHDTVIQELFASGMKLQVMESGLGGEMVDQLAGVVDSLDATIGHIREVIFDLQRPAGALGGMRLALTDVVSDATAALGFEPRCSLVGPLDTRFPTALANPVLAVVREALTNVAKHADASSVELLVRFDGDLLVEVVDDGCGILADTDRRSGLANLARRAEEWGGDFEVVSTADEGTKVRWRVPVAGT